MKIENRLDGGLYGSVSNDSLYFLNWKCENNNKISLLPLFLLSLYKINRMEKNDLRHRFQNIL